MLSVGVRSWSGPDRKTPSVSVEVVFETHSLSVDNELGIATGWLPGRLSEQGRRLAAELGERRREDGISAVFTSDLRRAVEIADIAFAASAIPIHRDARIRECNYGAMNGMPTARLRTERPLRIDRRSLTARAGVRRCTESAASSMSWRNRTTTSASSSWLDHTSADC